MKRVFETAECEAVRNSIFWLQRYEKHDNQMKGCGVKLKVSDWQMNAWTSWACDTVKRRRGMAVDRCVMLWRLKRQVWTWFAIWIWWAASELFEKFGKCQFACRRNYCRNWVYSSLLQFHAFTVSHNAPDTERRCGKKMSAKFIAANSLMWLISA